MKRLALLSLLLVAGCPAPGAFDDHTVPALDTVEAFEALAVSANGRASAKFIVTGFGAEAEGMRYLDGAFYELHDEWYWFRLLNGQRIPGREGIAPVSGQRFDSIADVYAWARAQAVLPLDLRWVDDGRLYSPRFYELGLFSTPRALGLGSLLHVSATSLRPERWGFMLEYPDGPTHAELVRFFERLEATLPPEVAPQVVWVVRSPVQEKLAQAMEAQRLPYHDRIVRLKELSVPGEVEVYNDGLAAGRLRVIRTGESFESATSADILLLEDVPDFLPLAAGVVTAVPQTPLAHLNLLARNRGIPNAYQGGVVDDPVLHDLAWLRAPVILRAAGPGELVLKPITEAQYAQWLARRGKTPVAVQQVDVATLPYVQDLRVLSAADSDALRPALGGKATGYLGLLAGAPDATPDQLLAVSIRPYVEHLAGFRPRIEAMLASAEFAAEVRVRALVLEGLQAFVASHPAPADQTFLADFLAAHPAGEVLGDLARGGGLKALLRAAPMAPATLGVLTDALRARFSHYAVTQGLRFRSSSTAEDVEGFNGAGLYDSNTGFLDAAAQADPGDQDHTVEWALKKTWASYWSLEAFEERALEAIDHLSGNMAVVVHARFDDAKEQSNGVFLFTLHGGAAVMDLNVQAGALSVTNPTSTALPEVVRVTLAAGAPAPVIERLRASTVVPAGTQVLTDAELLQTFARGRQVATLWLDRENGARPAAQRASTQVLDFEFRQVPEGWPALATGSFPARIVLKQTRSLEPGLRGLSAEVAALPLPRDVLSRARRVERRTCAAPTFNAVLVEALTDPLATPNLGHDADAFTASVALTFRVDVPELAVVATEVVAVDHLALSGVTHAPALPGWGVKATVAAGQKLSGLELRDGWFRLEAGAQQHAGTVLSCTTEVLLSTPTEYLLSLL